MKANENFEFYKEIDEFLSSQGFPFTSKYDDFCIVNYEEHKESVNSEIKPYSSNFFEITLNVGHNVLITSNHHTIKATDNNLLFLSPRHIIHWKFLDSKDTVKEKIDYQILFKPEFLSFSETIYDIYKIFPFFNHNTNPIFRITDELKNHFIKLVKKIYDEYQNNNQDSIEYLRSYLTIFLITAKRELSFHNNFTSYKTRAEEITYLFENTIQQTKHKRQNIGFYANLLNISPVYLSECVKKVTNKTAKLIIDEYVIMEAKSELLHSNKTITEISFSLGFDDTSNFISYFKKQTGLTPLKFTKT